MFRSSLQRHTRLGNVACRQISTFASRQIRSRPLVALSQRWPQADLQLIPLRQVAMRLYSQESAATSPRADTDDSPASLYNVTKFEDLEKLGVDERIVRAITVDMGYDTMTEVQALTVNPALKGVDLVAQAKTGTGKTLGFLIPIFQRILAADPSLAIRNRGYRPRTDDIRAIVLSPTRELAEQIGVEAKKLAQHTNLVVQTAVGGTMKREALHRMQRQGCHVLIATPGRLYDILSDPSTGIAAPNLQAFVLDEADRMLDVGFADAIRDIMDQLPPREDVDRQTLLFSATIPRDVVHLAKSMVKTDNFEFVQTINPDDTPTHERVPQHLVTVPGYENYFPAILEIAERAMEEAKSGNDPEALPFKAIVFFSNTATVQFASNVFRSTALRRGPNRIPVFDIHSKLSQNARTRSADSFRNAITGILFSSDVTARGMDFPNVSHVIQVGLPPDRDQYIHRVGRTGRAGKPGQGWLILAEDEIPEARYRLPGLPIKPNKDLKTAVHVVGDGSAPPEVSRYFDDCSQAYSRLPRFEFASVYHAMMSQKFGKRFAVEDGIKLLNDWASNGLGWAEPPAIAPGIARARGLTRIPGIRIGHDREEMPEMGFGSSSRFGSGRSQGGDFRSGSFGTRNSFKSDRASNPFERSFGKRDNGSRGDRGEGGGHYRASF
ncbi:ATP-dependent RNA helicase mss116 [Hypomontagnella monticulosa]|nr:ATP-dependent RNA helicase mss116 [Hypomontagnella monticulosa]